MSKTCAKMLIFSGIAILTSGGFFVGLLLPPEMMTLVGTGLIGIVVIAGIVAETAWLAAKITAKIAAGIAGTAGIAGIAWIAGFAGFPGFAVGITVFAMFLANVDINKYYASKGV